MSLAAAAPATTLIEAVGERATAAPASVPGGTAFRRRVTISAKPAPISIDLTRTAVIVIDMTNDFGSKQGMFDRAGIDISPIQQAVAPTARVLAAARKEGIKVVYLSMAYQPDLSDVGPPDSPNWLVHVQRLHVGSKVRAPDGTETRILIRDSWGTRVLNELRPQAGEPFIYKTRYSGFYNTELDQTLRALRVRYLVITGCTTSVCVESTLRDAMFRNYSPVLLADCSAEPIGRKLPRSNHESSLLVIETLLGWVSESEQFVAALEANRLRG
jgi:ureidoacrylate peracid hydrolase